MKQKLFFALALMVFGVGTIAQAALIDRGADTLGNHLFYDTSLNITWYDYTHSPNDQLTQWSWTQNLNVTMADGRSFTDWRLPMTMGTTTGYTDEGEMGHLFYYDYLSDPDLFSNLIQNGVYWTMMGNYEHPDEAFYYSFAGGQQWSGLKTTPLYALAVYDGDVGASVPIPAAIWLLGSGLLGLVGIRARVRREA